MPGLIAYPNLHISSVTLTVANLDRSTEYYESVIGLNRISREGDVATLGVNSKVLLRIIELKGAEPAPSTSPGLFHFAILVPDRLSLARFLGHQSLNRLSIVGAADHLVSEAIYLIDPDGHGIEVYRDRPSDEWKWIRGQVQMASDQLDFDGLLRLDDGLWAGMPDGTRIGHVHLRVNDLAKSEEFYHGMLGFDSVAAMPGALFVSAGHYHHHFGLNVWGGRAGMPAPEFSARLISVQIRVSSQEYFNILSDSIGAHLSEGVVAIHDPSGNLLEFRLV